MQGMPVAQPMTAEEFLARPYEEDLRGQELVEGEIVVSEATLLHNLVQGRLFHALAGWANQGPSHGQVFIPLDVRLDDLNVFAPDISWYSAAKVPDVDSQPPYPLPDLAIEVRSPSTWRYDIGAKKSAYERHGLPELWLVDIPASQVLIFRRSRPAAGRFDAVFELGRGDQLSSPLLPDFALQLEGLFNK
jgi:Uma2 family endonuclease